MALLNGTRHIALRALTQRWSPAPFSSSSRLSTRKPVVVMGHQNIILMGPPGAGKTTVGRAVAHRLGVPVIDVDDVVLEAAWGMGVAAKLAEVGGERFLEEEGRALSNFSAPSGRCVISLSGSNPLHAGAMRHLKRAGGLVVYLDVASEDDILRRLSGMKVDRIVGQGAGVSVRDILRYRRPFYERWLDTRVLCGTGDTVEDVAAKVLRAVERYQNSESETYISTRSRKKNGSTQRSPKYFSDVVVEGLAPDGGLYIPQHGFPKLDAGEWLRLADMSYPERALAILEKCIHPLDVPATELRTMVFKAYGANFASEAVAPVKHLVRNQFVQELFHGPTASFKDLALQLMPQLFAYCLPRSCNYLVLAATSGDTGGAVLSGFGGLGEGDRRRTAVLVFFPEEGVSEVQKLQMTSYRGEGGGNARAAGVRSDFDFCQRSVKRMLGDGALTGHLAVEYGTALSTANSINWARLLPQVVYHASAYLDLFRDGVIKFGDPVDVCIPTGNFGNAMSALYAKRMGVPIRKVICASNRNRVVTDFITTGEFDLRDRPLLASRSPAIDILKSSNLERFIYHVSDGDGHLVRELFARLERDGRFTLPGSLLRRVQEEEVLAGWCSEDDCLAAIRTVHRETGYVMDTHTAVAKVTADRLQDGRCPVVICSTAHYGKFAPAVLEALGVRSIPSAPLEQLRALGAVATRPQMHGGVLACVGESSARAHTVCPQDFSALVEEVETMIQNSFLKVL